MSNLRKSHRDIVCVVDGSVAERERETNVWYGSLSVCVCSCPLTDQQRGLLLRLPWWQTHQKESRRDRGLVSGSLPMCPPVQTEQFGQENKWWLSIVRELEMYIHFWWEHLQSWRGGLQAGRRWENCLCGSAGGQLACWEWWHSPPPERCLSADNSEMKTSS